MPIDLWTTAKNDFGSDVMSSENILSCCIVVGQATAYFMSVVDIYIFIYLTERHVVVVR